MFRLGSGTLGTTSEIFTTWRSLICGESVEASLAVGLTPREGLFCGCVVTVARRVEFPLPNPTKVHHRNKIATKPSTPAQISFFFSLGLLKSANSIFTPDRRCH